MPILLHVVDLAAPADDRTVHDPHGDQTGAVSIASVLDQWMQDWVDHRDLGERYPVPTVPALLGWFLAGDGARVHEACVSHPAVDEFARDVWLMVCQVRTALQISRRPDNLHVPCPSCEMLTLVRHPGAAYITCRNCPAMVSDDEYAELVAVAAETARGEAA